MNTTRRKTSRRAPRSREHISQESTEPRREFYDSVASVLRDARATAYRAINSTMVEAYWKVGRMIVEEEQEGQARAAYGTALIKKLSVRLIGEFGRGYSEPNLWNFKQFYLIFRAESADTQKLYTLCRELSWSHCRALMRIENPGARIWYLKEAVARNWSVRALQRQIHSLYYERLSLSRGKTSVIDEIREVTTPLIATPKDFIADPIVLEFLGMEDRPRFHEVDLEQAIIDKLQAFMLELGKGFTFVARQYRIRTETKNFFVDLVFYNHILKCFVLIDLKSGPLTHQDIGQIDMYVRLFEDKIKGKDDNPTVGLILCTEKDQTIAKYSVLNDGRQLFASKYRLYLPTEEQLRKELDHDRELSGRKCPTMNSIVGQLPSAQ